MQKKITNALISTFHKDGLDEIIRLLDQNNVTIYATGGTFDYVQQLGVKALTVESLTGYPSILGGRVKTLHPLVFGGILGRRDLPQDQQEMQQYHIPEFDLVMVDLYPFEKTVADGHQEADIIEKIDIGGISLIRAAAKNFNDVLIVPAAAHYQELISILKTKGAETDLEDRRRFATYAFAVSSHYDTAIFNYFNQTQQLPVFKQSFIESQTLRYGENPHQTAQFFGNLHQVFEQLNGKELSYNNLLDLDAAISLIDDFQEPTFGIIKHNNACGTASRPSLLQAWHDALAADPISAFGGILVTNQKIDLATAEEINKLFFEILLAPSYDQPALELLKSKKNRMILQRKNIQTTSKMFKSALNGVLVQDKDMKTEKPEELNLVTSLAPSSEQIVDLLFANKLVKHSKSNAIVLVKNKQLLASGVGQTSRVDALNQAIEKARRFGFDLNGAVMASDAFFPFPDCVEIAHQAGINAVIHPGGSIKDQDSIDYCDQHNMAMVITGFRHFKH